MLEFTLQDYESTLECLEDEYEARCSAFETLYPNLSDDDFEDMQESLGWSEEATLAGYESNYPGFYSMRQRLEDEAEAWLLIEPINFDLDPNNHYLSDFIENTLFNSFGQIIIDGVLHQYSADGTHYMIENPTCDNIALMQANPANPDIQGVIITKLDFKKGNITPASGNCFDGDEYRYVNEWQNGSDKRHRYVITWKRDFQSKGVAKTKITNYKKRNNKWKKRPMKSRVWVSGEMVEYMPIPATCIEPECYLNSNPEAGGFPLYKRRRVLRVYERRDNNYTGGRIKIQSPPICGDTYTICGGLNSDGTQFQHCENWN